MKWKNWLSKGIKIIEKVLIVLGIIDKVTDKKEDK